MNKKKGLSHVDVIVSLVIFLGFFIFLLIFLRPLTKTEISPVILDIFQEGIENFANVNYSYITVKIDENLQTDKTCLSVPLTLTNVIVKDETDTRIDAGSTGNKISFLKSGDFYTIYSSPVFKETSLTGCYDLVETEYSLGFLRESQVLYYENLNYLKQQYEQDYNSLKSGFKIPSSNDFAFSVRDTEGNEIISAVKKQPSKISVIARDIPSQLLYYNVEKVDWEIKYVVLNIQAW